MTEVGIELMRLVEADDFRETLIHACDRAPATTMILGVGVEDQAVYLECRDGRVHDAPGATVAPGCLTKLLTGALAIHTLQDRGLSLDLPIARLVGIDGMGSERLRLSHLLNHTHGLDTTTSELRLQPDGAVDTPWLARQLCEPRRIAEPGALHSYANASAWLTAALIEAISGNTFTHGVMTELFRDADLDDGHPRLRAGESTMCAATGRGLEISASTFLGFLKSFWRGSARGEGLAGMEAVTLPGWSGTELGLVGGWKTFGDGWLGHSSVQRAGNGLVRIHPERRIALFVCSPDQACGTAAVALFGRQLSSLVPARLPRLLPDGAAERSSYLGVFEVAATRIFVEEDGEGGLRMRVFRRSGAGLESQPLHVCSLRAAADHLFYTRPVHPELFPYIQFVGGARPFEYLWNGKGLWRRAEGAQDTTQPQ